MSRVRSFAWTLAGLTVAALAVRVAYVFVQRDALAGDGIFFVGTARTISKGDGYLEPFSLLTGARTATALHPPLYSLYLAASTEVGVTSIRGYQVASSLPER